MDKFLTENFIFLCDFYSKNKVGNSPRTGIYWPEADSEPSQTSKKDLLTKIVNGIHCVLNTLPLTTKNVLSSVFCSTEIYLEPCQASKMEHFAKIIDGSKPVIVFAKARS